MAHTLGRSRELVRSAPDAATRPAARAVGTLCGVPGVGDPWCGPRGTGPGVAGKAAPAGAGDGTGRGGGTYRPRRGNVPAGAWPLGHSRMPASSTARRRRATEAGTTEETTA